MTPDPGRRRDDEDIDARFADIVSRLDMPDPQPGDDDQPEDVDPSDGAEHGSDSDAQSSVPDNGPPDSSDEATAAYVGPASIEPNHPPEPDVPDELATWRGQDGEEEEEHFIPPPPPPLPAGDLHFWAIVVGLTLGPLILVLTHVFGLLRGGLWTTSGLVLAVGGFVLLVLRSPTDRDPHDTTGGAQV